MVSRKIIVVAAILVVAAIVLTLGADKFMKAPSAGTNAPPAQPASGSEDVTPEEASIISTQLDSLVTEQASAISNDASDFSASMQDSMASDSSQFMYR